MIPITCIIKCTHLFEFKKNVPMYIIIFITVSQRCSKLAFLAVALFSTRIGNRIISYYQILEIVLMLLLILVNIYFMKAKWKHSKNQNNLKLY